jgi:hypothetical protein
MTYYSKKAIVSIVTSLIVFLYLFMHVLGVQNAGVESMSNLWGAFFIKLLAIEVVVKLIIMIVFNIINRLAASETEPTIADERDKIIELKAIRNFCFMFAFGFFLAMGALMLQWPITAMFHILALGFLISGVVLNLSYIFYYQRGF